MENPGKSSRFICTTSIVLILKLQDSLPAGATVLGTILSSDKTQLSSMTGNRQAHPVLISLADIDMDFRMKASHHAYLLLALQPIAKFIVKKPDIRGVLESRLYHSIMDHVLQPLKKTAEIGTIMTDPLGWRRFCFTPLVSFIVDTPESALIAGVAGKTSSVTTASYKDFGDAFQHSPRTAKHTIKQLMLLEEETDPWDLEEYVKKAKQRRLNGVHRPFWRDWPLADPSEFLTPEILHHWFKMFYDHPVKWCIEALGAPEIDFRFSVLRHHVGMRHFHEGISKAKQVTGREHRDMMRYIVPVIAGSVSKSFLIAIRSLVDFFYHGQAPTIGENILSKMFEILRSFHENKPAILKAGVRKGKKGPIDNWHIPKLEFLQSVIPAIRANGVPLQWSADVTEHYHITDVKVPASNSNNQKYEAQICRYLDRREKCKRFNLATAIQGAGVELGVPFDTEDSDLLEEQTPLLLNRTSELLEKIAPVARISGSERTNVNYFVEASLLLQDPAALTPLRIFTSVDESTAFQLGRDHLEKQLTVDAAASKYDLPDLRNAFVAFFDKPDATTFVIGGRRPTSTRRKLPFLHLRAWKSIRIQSRAFHDSRQVLVPETVNASPPGYPNESWKYGRGDTVIVNGDPQHQWPRSGLEGVYFEPALIPYSFYFCRTHCLSAANDLPRSSFPRL